MKIAIAVCSNEENAGLAEVFGRSPFFLLFDVEKRMSAVCQNPYADAVGGAGINTARFLIEHNCDAVIVKQIGRQALLFLKSAGIPVFKSIAATCRENLLLFHKGLLEAA